MKSSGLAKCVEWKWEKDAIEVDAGAREKCDMFHWSAAAVKVVNTHRLRADGIRRVCIWKLLWMRMDEKLVESSNGRECGECGETIGPGDVRETRTNSNGTLSGRHAEHGNNEYFVHRKRMQRARARQSMRAHCMQCTEHTPLQRGRDWVFMVAVYVCRFAAFTLRSIAARPLALGCRIRHAHYSQFNLGHMHYLRLYGIGIVFCANVRAHAPNHVCTNRVYELHILNFN